MDGWRMEQEPVHVMPKVVDGGGTVQHVWVANMGAEPQQFHNQQHLGGWAMVDVAPGIISTRRGKAPPALGE